MKKQNNIKGSMLIDYVNLMRDTIEELHDWEQETERSAIVAAVDNHAGRACFLTLGDTTKLELALLTIILEDLPTESRHRMTLALAERYRAELDEDEDEALANQCPPTDQLN